MSAENGHQIFPVGSEVQVTPGSAHALSTDETPIRTDLYPYGPGNSYVVTGPPLSFVFPKSAYAADENMRGGPQAIIRLRIDRETFRPIGSLLRGRDWPSNDIWLAYRRDFVERDLSLVIRSNAFDSPRDPHGPTVPAPGSSAERARICGFAMAARFDPTFRGPDRRVIAGTELPAASYSGQTISAEGPRSTVSCPQGSSYCRVSFDFHDRLVNYSIRASDLCGHEAMTARVRRLLTRHRTS